mgnify:CR=1 FL=1
MSALPASFSYFVNRLAGVSRKQVKITPNNSTSVKQAESITFVLPTDSICDLQSLKMIYNFKYQNDTVDGAKARLRYVPAPHQLVRSATWSINNTAVCGSENQNFSAVYECLRVASSGNDNVNSRKDEYNAPPIANLIGAANSANDAGKLVGVHNERVCNHTVSRRCKMTDFLGLQTSPNSMNYDTSIFGETRLELQLTGAEAALISGTATPSAADNDWEITDVHCVIDVISFASPEYDMLMSQILQEGSLLMPFNNITSQKSLLNSAIRFNVASSSLDMVGFALLKDVHNQATHVVADSNRTTDKAFTDGLVPNQVQLCYRNSSSAAASTLANMSDSVDATWYFTINGSVYPSQGATKLIDGAEYTKNTYAAGKDDYNQLFLGASTELQAQDDATTALSQKIAPSAYNLEYAKNYKRVNYLDRNCFVALRTCLDVPAAQSSSRALSGLNTLGQSSQIQLNLQGFNNSTDFALMIGQGSSVIQVAAGQQVSVIH